MTFNITGMEYNVGHSEQVVQLLFELAKFIWVQSRTAYSSGSFPNRGRGSFSRLFPMPTRGVKGGQRSRSCPRT